MTVQNPVKTALAAGGVSLGSWVQIGHSVVAEIMARAGFQWLAIDLEHSVIDIESVQPLIQVFDLGGVVPLVRVTANDPALIKRVMDAGALGVIVPMVNSPEEAEQAVAATKYPPRGIRSVGLARAQGFGTRFAEYFASINRESLVIVQVEHRRAVEQIEAILGVDGVDGFLLGPYDLSGSYGVAGELDHPLLKEAEQRVLAAARAAGVAPGIHVVHASAEAIERRVAEGFRFIAVGVDTLLLGDAARSAARVAADVVARVPGVHIRGTESASP